jgi:hypothetical protein
VSGEGQRRGIEIRRFAPALWTALAWVGAWFTAGNEFRSTPRTWHDLFDFLYRFFFKALGGFPAAQGYVVDVLRIVRDAVAPTLWVYAAWGTFLVPLGFVARMMGRAWLRSGGRDPIAGLREWASAHPKWSATIAGALPVLWGLLLAKVIPRHFDFDVTGAELVPIVFASTAFEYFAARATFRAFVAPTVDPEEATRIEIGPDEIVFDAVAVTRETRAAVGGLAGLSLAMTVWVAALPIATLFRDARLFAAVGVYAGFAALSATVFRFASRVAVGVDGVLVKGTSRTRFFPYRELDEVRDARGDIELVRKGRVVLRLQLHGADAVRRDAVVGRIRENIARVQRGEHAMAAQLVSASSQEQLTRVASGGADYRAASLSREALWALIEGPAVDASARRAAAEALAKTSDGVDRARLRVAAEHCADPKVRVALEQLAEGADDAESAEAGARAAASRV